MSKGQLDFPIVPFIVIVFGLLIVGPVMLSVFSHIQTPISNTLGNLTSAKGGDIAQANFNKVIGTAYNMWDQVVMFCFVIAVIMLIVSSFLIDTSPFWLVLYIFICMMIIILMPNIMESITKIYGNQYFATEVAKLSYLNQLQTNFIFILVGIMFITGIIIYGKLARSVTSGGRL